MRTIKIFAFPTHNTIDRTSGVDFARIIQPMKHLNGYSDGEVKFKVDVFDPKTDNKNKKRMDWLKVAKNYDIIYFNYLNNAWGFAAMGAMARGFGKKMILDIDDSLWNLKEDNTAYSVYKKGSEAIGNFTSICNEVDYMTATNSYLRNVITHNTYKRHKNIKVFPNYIDLDLYSHRAKFKDTGNITLLHHGSSTHFNDLQEPEFVKGIDRIMSDYPNVTLKFVGAFVPYFKKRWGVRYDQYNGTPDIYKWIKGKFRDYMDEADILICPLTEDVYNRCKSGIKYLETSSAKIPGVYQDSRQYSELIEHGKNGYLAKTADDWYESLKELIDDPKKRKEVGEAAFKTVEENHQMKNNLKEYADFFKSVVDTG